MIKLFFSCISLFQVSLGFLQLPALDSFDADADYNDADADYSDSGAVYNDADHIRQSDRQNLFVRCFGGSRKIALKTRSAVALNHSLQK